MVRTPLLFYLMSLNLLISVLEYSESQLVVMVKLNHPHVYCCFDLDIMMALPALERFALPF